MLRGAGVLLRGKEKALKLMNAQLCQFLKGIDLNWVK